MFASESERKEEVQIHAARRDRDMRIPLRLTLALNPEVRKERCGETVSKYSLMTQPRRILGETWQPSSQSKLIFYWVNVC